MIEDFKKVMETYFTDTSKNELTFIETGSYEGDGIQIALDYGFKQVRSVEITEKYYELCRDRFSDEIECGKVKLYLGDSKEKMSEMTQDVEGKMCFWLDAHCSYGETGGSEDKNPVLYELNLIKNLKGNDHIIMIDDLRLFRRFDYMHDGWEVITEQMLIDNIKTINKNYEFRYGEKMVTDQVFNTRTLEIEADETRYRDILIARTDWR